MSCNDQTDEFVQQHPYSPRIRLRAIDHLPRDSSNRTRTTATRKVFRVGELPVWPTAARCGQFPESDREPPHRSLGSCHWNPRSNGMDAPTLKGINVPKWK